MITGITVVDAFLHAEWCDATTNVDGPLDVSCIDFNAEETPRLQHSGSGKGPWGVSIAILGSCPDPAWPRTVFKDHKAALLDKLLGIQQPKGIEAELGSPEFMPWLVGEFRLADQVYTGWPRRRWRRERLRRATTAEAGHLQPPNAESTACWGGDDRG